MESETETIVQAEPKAEPMKAEMETDGKELTRKREEFHRLARELAQTDSCGLTWIEQAIHRVRIECAVERNQARPNR